MASKLKKVNDITSGGSFEKDSKFVSRLLNTEGDIEGRTSFYEIPLDEITPRSVNQFRQNRIEKLAKSIRNTNNRLIHPITLVRAEDLPKDSEIIKSYEKKGIDVSAIKYIIVSGERRYRAFCLLREQEKGEKKKSLLDMSPSFDTITANILTPAEAKNESVFYEDSNIQSRQLTPIEAMLHIKDAVMEVTSPEEMRAALIEMNDGSEEGIPKSDSEIKKKFRTDRYCAYCLEKDLGIEGVPEGTIRNHLAILNHCTEDVIDALIAGEYTITEAKVIRVFPAETQNELLKLWKEDRESYKKKIAELKAPAEDKKKKRVSRIDARKQLASYKDKVKKGVDDLTELSKKLGEYDKETMQEGLKKIAENIKLLEENIDILIGELK